MEKGRVFSVRIIHGPREYIFEKCSGSIIWRTVLTKGIDRLACRVSCYHLR